MPGTAAPSPAPAVPSRRQGLARLLVWNDRPDFVPSLRDERGASLTPGLFTGVRGARAQTAALAEARRLALRQDLPLFAFVVEASLSMDGAGAAAPGGSWEGAGPLPCASLDLARLTRSREAELLSLLGLEEAAPQEGGSAPRRLARLACDSPASFFPRLFAHPACARLALVQWNLPGGTRGICAGREGLPLATVRPSQIANITLCAPARDLLQERSGEARQARIRYLLGLPDEPRRLPSVPARPC